MLAVNGFALLLHLAFGWYLFRRYPRYSVLLGLVYFFQTWSLISCGYNDLGVYNFELFRYTETTLATTRLALFYIVFNAGFWIVVRLLDKRPLKRVDYRLSAGKIQLGNFRLLFQAALVCALAYIGYTLIAGGIPLSQGVDKLLFYQEAGGFERMLLNYGFLFAFLLGYLHRPGKWFAWTSVVLILLLLYLVAAGNKFSALLTLSSSYLAASGVRWLAERPQFYLFRKRNLVLMGGIVLVLGAGAYASYLFWGRDTGGALELLRDRVFALQGHLWWASDYNLFELGRFDPQHWQAELAAILNPSGIVEGTVGMKYVMVQVIGAENAFPIFDIGYLYTMAYPAILTLTFAYPLALLIQAAAGAFFGLLLYYLHYAVTYRHLFRSIVVMTVIIPFIAMLGSGNFWAVITIGMALKLFFLAACEIGLVRSGETA